jgi:putative transposase
VAQARDYPWSSHGHYVGLRTDSLLTPHPLYWELGNTPFAREVAYSELVQAGLSAETQTSLTQSALRGWALGEPDFVADLQKRTQRRVSQAVAGRPISVAKGEVKIG